jgi:hypothetical protein
MIESGDRGKGPRLFELAHFRPSLRSSAMARAVNTSINTLRTIEDSCRTHANTTTVRTSDRRNTITSDRNQRRPDRDTK